jgi:glycosyltransferase involved in cell wall biosynthesis
MKIAFYADARSPIAINWVRWFTERHIDVHWISSREAEPPLEGLASFQVIACFPTIAGEKRPNRIPGFALTVSAFLRHWIMPFRINRPAQALRQALHDLKPDLVHAMRIPLEGMVAARALERRDNKSSRLAISIWGNDFTLHASASPIMRTLTKRTVSSADGLHADCNRDLQLAQAWGLRKGVPILQAPGNGGIREKIFFSAGKDPTFADRFAIPKDNLLIFNPRGMRGYARTDTFFLSIPYVLRSIPTAHFVAAGMAGSSEAEDWVRKLDLAHSVTLLPALSPEDMAACFRFSPISLSITTHDGTPNTLLEAMACGSFPICGDLESIREWIKSGVNGLLVPPDAPVILAQAVVRAAGDPSLRRSAADHNRQLIQQRAAWQTVMPTVEHFYRQIVEASSP